MGKQMPNRLKEVVYTLSPFETSVMSGLWKDLPAKIQRKVSEVLHHPPSRAANLVKLQIWSGTGYASLEDRWMTNVCNLNEAQIVFASK